MVCSKKKINSCYWFYFKHSILYIVDKYKYLGTILQSNGSLKSACDDFATRARRAYFALKSKPIWFRTYTYLVAKTI
jgi:hypothetical protein